MDEISPQVFQAAAAAMQVTLASIRSGAERRAEERRTLFGAATIIPCSARLSRQAVVVIVRDFSPSGIGIVYQEALHAGEQFILHIPEADIGRGLKSRRKYALLYTVRQFRPLANHCFAVGAVFTRELEPKTASNAAELKLDADLIVPVLEKQARHNLSNAVDREAVHDLQQRLMRHQAQNVPAN